MPRHPSPSLGDATMTATATARCAAEPETIAPEEVAALRQYYEGVCLLRSATTEAGIVRAHLLMNEAEVALWMIRREVEIGGDAFRNRVRIEPKS